MIGEYVYDLTGGRHQAFYSPTKDVHYKDVYIKAGERVQVEQSLKYSPEEAQGLWKTSGLVEMARWSASSEAYSKWLTVFAFRPRTPYITQQLPPKLACGSNILYCLSCYQLSMPTTST